MAEKKNEKGSLPTPHDAFFKANLEDKTRFCKTVKQHFAKDIVEKIDFDKLIPVSTDFIQKDLSYLASDVLYSTKVNDKDAYIYVLWEHQSSSDPLMAFRVLVYTIQIMQKHLKAGYKKLPLVLPAIMYHGKESPYPYSRNVIDCFSDKELAEEYAFRSFTLVDLTIIDDEQLAKFDPDLLFEFMLKHSRDNNLPNELTVMLLNNPEQSQYFLNSGYNLLNQIFYYIESRKDVDPKYISNLVEVINKNTNGAFMTYLERREENAQKQGMQQGVLKGKQETARNLFGMSLSVDQVAKATGLDLDTVLKLKKDVAKA